MKRSTSLWPPEGWSGFDVARLLFSRWTNAPEERDKLVESIFGRVKSDLSTEQLSFLHCGLEQLCGRDVVVGDDFRRRFFSACGRWPKGGPTLPELSDIPAGDFMMGGPEGVGHARERPQHPVTISAFRMMRTTVTEAMYGEFDSKRPAKNPSLPVVNVSWWEIAPLRELARGSPSHGSPVGVRLSRGDDDRILVRGLAVGS